MDLANYKISGAELNEITESAKWENNSVIINGQRLAYVDTIKFVAEFRWAYVHMAVYKDDDGKFWGFEFEVPASESQDGQDDWSYINPRLFQVEQYMKPSWRQIMEVDNEDI